MEPDPDGPVLESLADLIRYTSQLWTMADVTPGLANRATHLGALALALEGMAAIPLAVRPYEPPDPEEP